MKSILPDWLYCNISQKYSLSDIQEIRIRLNQAIQICYRGKYFVLTNESGLYIKPIVATRDLIDYIISTSTKKSIYAFEDQIKNGYIVTGEGIRIGLCGTAVMKKGEVSFIKNISSLNIRIAHQVSGCSSSIINYIVSNGKVKNTLIISPPGSGKTTLVRDLANKLSNDFHIPNIMLVDEKFELGGENQIFDIGENVDIMQGSDKCFAFYESIKVMNPSVIITDEIISEEDIDGVKFAMGSGVSVIATVHSEGLDTLKSKVGFKDLITEKRFDRLIVLSKRYGVGTIEAVYNENLNALFIPSLL